MSDTNTQYMLLFTIGPVQSFIAQARKTRDLWLGSYLLSVLMEAAMKNVRNALVFPAKPFVDTKIPDLPNRYIAIFDDPEQAKNAAIQSENNIRECWEGICKDVWDNVIVKAPLCDVETKKIWDRQVNPERFFEMFWVVVPGEKEHYSEWLDRTQVALAARKRLRHVQQDNSINNERKEVSEAGEKSTISGDREALRSSGLYREDVRKFWRTLARNGRHTARDLNKDGAERLDAIDSVKRFAHLSQALEAKHVNANFPSTSSIATATFVERLFDVITSGQSSLITGPLKKWLDATKRLIPDMPPDNIPYLFAHANGDPNEILKRDGDCYFLETFVQTRLEKNYNTPSDSSGSIASQGWHALRELLTQTDAINITRPTPYYAMIQMDGDKMGVLLGNVDQRNGEEEHRDISAALSLFSRGDEDNKSEMISARTLVEDMYPGRLIYAGGDDVFALAPLARDSAPEGESLTVLQLADKLQQTYHNIVEKAVVGDDRKQNVTASTGIAIAHHFTSLSYVRRASKEAESQAKKTYGRNSLVVTLLRRSGEQTRVGCRWTYDNYTMKRKGEDGKSVEVVPLRPIDIFSEFYRLFKEDKLSRKVVPLLLEEAPALVHPALFLDKESETANNVRTMQASEIKRVLRRQRNSKDVGSGTTDDDTIRLAENLVALATAMDADTRKSNQNAQASSQEKTRAVELHSEDRRYGLVEVLGWLQVMVFLTRKEQE